MKLSSIPYYDFTLSKYNFLPFLSISKCFYTFYNTIFPNYCYC